jgi:DNA-binding XRE family transcriptional regulator
LLANRRTPYRLAILRRQARRMTRAFQRAHRKRLRASRRTLTPWDPSVPVTAETIRWCRATLVWTQVRMAAALGLSRRQYIRWEHVRPTSRRYAELRLRARLLALMVQSAPRHFGAWAPVVARMAATPPASLRR